MLALVDPLIGGVCAEWCWRSPALVAAAFGNDASAEFGIHEVERGWQDDETVNGGL